MTNAPLSQDTQALMNFEANKKSAGVAYILWFFLGGLGGHNFYIGKQGAGIGQIVLSIMGWMTLLLAGIGLLFLIPLGIWLLIDVITLGGKVTSINSRLMDSLNSNFSASTNTADELAKFAQLKEQGAITEEEYAQRKRQLLG